MTTPTWLRSSRGPCRRPLRTNETERRLRRLPEVADGTRVQDVREGAAHSVITWRTAERSKAYGYECLPDARDQRWVDQHESRRIRFRVPVLNRRVPRQCDGRHRKRLTRTRLAQLAEYRTRTRDEKKHRHARARGNHLISDASRLIVGCARSATTRDFRTKLFEANPPPPPPPPRPPQKQVCAAIKIQNQKWRFLP